MSSSGNRRAGWLALTTIALLGVVIAAVVFLRPDGRAPRAQTADVATPATSPSPVPGERESSQLSDGPGNYRAVKRPCRRIDTDGLFGTDLDRGVVSSNARSKRGDTALIRCAIDVDDAGQAGVQIELVDPSFAREMFRGLREAQAQLTPVTEVPGLGEAAYSYVDEQAGPHVVTVDGNLHLAVRFSPFPGGQAPASDDELITGLVKLARRAMRALEA